MYILGINAYHAGASACLIRDGELIAAAEEERFTRIKYCAGFPSEAIRYCLGEARITARALDHVGISRDPRANLHKKAWFAVTRRPSISMVRDRLANAARVHDTRAELTAALGVPANQLHAQFHNVEHHRAHMASAFFVSPFRRAAILSVDGMGDFVSTMWGVGNENHLKSLGEINFPHSLGIFYTAVCQWLGFRKYGDEGKVMGLAPYGQPRYTDLMHRLVHLHQDGTFELHQDAFVHHATGANMTWNDGAPTLGTLYSPKFLEILGPPKRPAADAWQDLSTPENQYYVDVAASLQAVLEEAELGLVRKLQQATGAKALCIAGGVGLNSSFNGKVRVAAPAFEDVFVQPAASDAGTSLGVAYYIHHQLLGNPRKFVMSVAATGPAFGDRTVKETLQRNQLSYECFDEERLARLVAELIEQGNVVGWFQDRMEWGPRALGNRSILADPRRDDMKAILNARVKHREHFRPFAPAILAEATGDFFDQDYPDPFMTMVYGVRPEKRSLIPAVTHVDGTGRLQSVFRGGMPLYWQVIKEFEALTGVPVVLNTSFNDNEPIVCTPQEATDCFMRTRMDVLVLGRYVVRKA
jgi:carbamoyltransferase